MAGAGLLLLAFLFSGFALLTASGSPWSREIMAMPSEVPGVSEQAEVAASSNRDPFSPKSKADLREKVIKKAKPEYGRDPFSLIAETSLKEKNVKNNSARYGRDPFKFVPNITAAAKETTKEIAEGTVSLQVTTADRCWLEVIVDGKTVLRKNVPAGTTLSFEGARTIRLEQVGREGALSLTLNGKELGLLSNLSKDLQLKALVYTAGEEQIRASLGRRYDYGVLVGLEFSVIN